VTTHDRPDSQLAFGVGLVAPLVTALIADANGWNNNLAAAAVSTTGVLPNAVALWMRRRRNRAQVHPAAQFEGLLARSPLAVVGTMAFGLVFVDKMFEYFARALVAGIGPTTDILPVMSMLAILVGMPVLLYSTYRMARTATHYLQGRRALLWLTLAIMVFTVYRGLLNVIVVDDSLLTDIQAITSALYAVPLLLLACFAGKRRADATHVCYLMNRLARRLQPQDQAAVLELLRDTVGGAGRSRASP
jgi:hypothetical protein